MEREKEMGLGFRHVISFIIFNINISWLGIVPCGNGTRVDLDNLKY